MRSEQKSIKLQFDAFADEPVRLQKGPSNFSLMLFTMSQFEYKQFYERNRPHIHPPDSVLFVTFRLAGSVPKAVLEQYKAEKEWLETEIGRLSRRNSGEIVDAEHLARLKDFHRKWFGRFEKIIDLVKEGPMWLGQPEIRQIVTDKLFEGDDQKYRLDAYSIMSNHVHVVFKPKISEQNLSPLGTRKPRFVSSESTYAQIMQGIKGATARRANLVLGRSGSFWETESYDHFVRDEVEFYRIIRYTLNNPVKAKLVERWQDWPGTYLAPRLLERFSG
jgi:REP element-mobilizing transposase RayT